MSTNDLEYFFISLFENYSQFFYFFFYCALLSIEVVFNELYLQLFRRNERRLCKGTEVRSRETNDNWVKGLQYIHTCVIIPNKSQIKINIFNRCVMPHLG